MPKPARLISTAVENSVDAVEKYTELVCMHKSNTEKV